MFIKEMKMNRKKNKCWDWGRGGGAQTRRYLKEEKNVPWNGGGEDGDEDGEAKSM